jgi:hypothetical protein
MVDGAVCSELLSASNSLIFRENTGNFSDSGRLLVDFAAKTPCLRYGFFRNSLLNGTGNFDLQTGNSFGLSGNFQGGAAKFI